MHKYFTLIVFWSTLTVVGAEAGTTYVSGVIDTNTVWTPAGSPYIVIDTTIVDSGVTLDIEAGVDVRIDSAKYIMIKGALNAIGTATDSIIISTLDTTNRWSRLWFKPASAGSLKYCRIEYAGNSAIYGDSASYLYIDYNNISNNLISGVDTSSGAGIYIAGIAKITNNIIFYNRISLPESGPLWLKSGYGAGIYNRGSSEIINNTISNNGIGGAPITDCVSGYGAGVYNEGDAEIINNTISRNGISLSPHNLGPDARGAGIYSRGVSTVSNNTISSNWAYTSAQMASGSSYGGGIYTWGSDTIINNTISSNSARGYGRYGATGCGGGIYVRGNPSYIADNIISNNTAQGNISSSASDPTGRGRGGGIYASPQSKIINNIITKNVCNGSSGSYAKGDSRGGGIYASHSCQVLDNIILNNTASAGGYQVWVNDYAYGGGIYACSLSVVSNNIIAKNTSRADTGIAGGSTCAYGGGISISDSVMVSHNTILYNHAEGREYCGGSIYAIKGSPSIRQNTIIDTTLTAIYINNGALIDSSNLYSTGYTIYNHSNLDINARHNYWYTIDTSSINAKIWDYYDSSGVGRVFYEPFLTSGNTIAPVPPPLNLTATQTDAGKITMSWDAVPVIDLAGYKIWYDTDTTDYPYEGTGVNEGNSPIDVGNVTTFALTGLARGDQYLVVRAYDVGGDSSWYSNEAIVLVVGVENVKIEVQNTKLEIYPNPFVQKTGIQYSIPNRQHLSLKIYDIAGRCVKTLVNGKKEPGCYKIDWDTKELGTGIYFATLTTANHKLVKKVILIK